MTAAPMPTVILRGALVILAPGPPATSRTVVFQYNPESLTREVAPSYANGDQLGAASSLQYAGAPTETLTVEVEFDAFDQPPPGATYTIDVGVAPQIAALETLAYPTVMAVTQAQTYLASGQLEIAPYATPVVLFVSGAKRVMPVKVTRISVTEQTFNSQLVPIRARIALTMQVLSYSDVPTSDRNYSLYLTYQAAKEAWAAQATSSGTVATIGITPPTS